MTMKHRMLLGAVLAAGFMATSLAGQDAPRLAETPPPPLIPANEPTPIPQPPPKPAEAKPAARTARPTKPASQTRTTAASAAASASDLKPGAAVATEKNVNVRGQAAINSEIVTHLKRGDLVTVLETVTLTKHGPDEPAKWAKIQLPKGSAVWAHALFIDSAKTVKPNRLNLRSGPGENYSILGRIDKGTVVRELERKGDWIKIEPPTSAYAFAAAHLFSQAPAVLAAASRKPGPSSTPKVASVSRPPGPVSTTTVEPRQEIVTAGPPPVTTAATRPPTPVPAPAPTPTTNTILLVGATVPEPPPLAETSNPPIQMTEAEPLIRRVVTREGIVRGSASIQAPTYFVLRSRDNNKTINYLLSIDTNIVLRSYQHQRVIVVGEEVLDERWPNTPVIDVESIETVP